MAQHSDTGRAPAPAVSLDELAGELRRHGIDARASDGCRRVRGMSIDSRGTGAGNLFVCKGAAFRPSYLAGAVERGAAAFLCAEDDAAAGAVEAAAPLNVPAALAAAAPRTPCLVVSDLRRAMALAAPLIYGHPERELTLIGITGTKGKTTVSYMLRAIMDAARATPAIVGSIEVDDGVERFESHNTTPEAPDLWRHLRNSVDAGRREVIMEVSSQALKYDRVLGLTFDIGCFLNIGSDHISPLEHPTFEDYFSSKLKLFGQSRVAVVNLDTDHLDEVLDAARAAGGLVTVSSRRADAQLRATGASTAGGRLTFEIVERGERHPVTLGIPGLFNIDNALAAAALARRLDIGYDAIAAGLAHVRVPGRMELVSSPDRRIVSIVDYAHNELSYRALFESVASEYPGRFLIAVFGAPGDKAHERRRVLPQVAGAYADLIIYTEEDPAHERVADICVALAANTPPGVAYETVLDRERAIERAFAVARAQDGPSVVLLLAKGDERRQHRGDSYPEITSDLALARAALEG